MTDCEAWPRSWARRKQGVAHVCLCKPREAGSLQKLTENKADIESVPVSAWSQDCPQTAPRQTQHGPSEDAEQSVHLLALQLRSLSPEQPFSTPEPSCTGRVQT